MLPEGIAIFIPESIHGILMARKIKEFTIAFPRVKCFCFIDRGVPK